MLRSAPSTHNQFLFALVLTHISILGLMFVLCLPSRLLPPPSQDVNCLRLPLEDTNSSKNNNNEVKTLKVIYFAYFSISSISVQYSHRFRVFSGNCCLESAVTEFGVVFFFFAYNSPFPYNSNFASI